MGGSKQEKSVPSATATKRSKDSKVMSLRTPPNARWRSQRSLLTLSAPAERRAPLRVLRRSWNEGVPPPNKQCRSVGDFESNFQEGGSILQMILISLYPKHCPSGVQALFYESTPSTQVPLGDMIPPGKGSGSRHARADSLEASEERDYRGATRHTRILFQHVSGARGRIPIRPFQADILTILWMPLPRGGVTIWVFPDLRNLVPYRLQAPHQLFGTKGSIFCSA